MSITSLIAQLSVAALLVVGCLSSGGRDGTVDSETHFLVPCEGDSSCVAERQCICGVCSIPCDAAATCTAVNGVSSCVDASSVDDCSAGPMVTLCLALCTADADCGGAGLGCVDGLCVDVDDTPAPDVVDDTTEADTADADDGADVPALVDSVDLADVAVDTSGPGVDGSTSPQTCTRCDSLTECSGGLACYADSGSAEPGGIPPLICAEPFGQSLSYCPTFCAQTCGGNECGSATGGCLCGSCPGGKVCQQGTCVDEQLCAATGCVDVAGVSACVGTSFEQFCNGNLGVTTCTCSATGPVCDDLCSTYTQTGPLPVGVSCTSSGQCSSLQCVGGLCRKSCGTTSDCDNQVCLGNACVDGVGLGDICATDAECIGGECSAGICGPPCSAVDETCPAGQICFVAGAVVGVCVETCDHCGDTCPAGVCSAVGANFGLGCISPSYSSAWNPWRLCADACTIACSEAGRSCGAMADGCYCGDCAAGTICDDGVCTGTPSASCGSTCTDAFGTDVCSGVASAQLCGFDPASEQISYDVCTCNSGAFSCPSDCGALSVAGGQGYGAACVTGADCATGECHMGVCAPRCYIEADNGPLYGCPEGFQCNVPGAATGFCLRECISDNSCPISTECLPSLLVPPNTTVCRAP